MKGINFLPLHELFDRVAGEAAEYSDLIAERIAALGGSVEGRLEETAQHSVLPRYPSVGSEADKHVSGVSDSLTAFAKLIRAPIEVAEASGDQATADILTEILRRSEKHLWLVQSHATTAH